MKILELMKIRHKGGYAYIARTKHPELSSHKKPSMAIVLEDGKPLLGPANALYEEIRKLGNGRYFFWFGDVYFSSSDNSNPRTNGRSYSVQYTEDELHHSNMAYFRLNRMMRPIYRLLFHPAMPGPFRNFLMEIGYSFDSLKRLKLLFPFWSLFYWLSFFYTVSWHQKKQT